MTAVYCSGLLAGPGPSPGLGIARSLREGFPDAQLVGVEYATRSPASRHPVFDELWARGPWPELRLDAYAGEILARLDAGAAWISGSERETRWLAEAVGAHDRLLSPSASALQRLGAPADLARRLGLPCPPAISTREPDWQLAAFGREHGWRLRLRGPGREPGRIDSWRSLERARARLARAWSDPGLRLHVDVEGAAESIVFAAHRGRVLGAQHLRAVVAAADGTISAGRVGDLVDALAGVPDALAAELAEAGWTGGGEIELVRSPDGALWVVAWRPRFADWVHAATLAGANLPAALLGAATGRSPAAAEARGGEFVRAVVELPAARPLPAPVTAAGGVVRAGGYLSGMPDPGRVAGGARLHAREDAVAPPEELTDALAELRDAPHTPHVHRLDPAPRYATVAARIRAASAGACRVQVAYSIKTDPDAGLLAAARRHGFLAEAITAAEMRRAQQAGFEGDEIILNGPAKRWPLDGAPIRTFAAFADSVEELTELAALARSGGLRARYLGARLRPPSVASRFGVRLDDFTTFSGVVAQLRRMPPDQPLGLHFHWSSSEAGHATWFDTIEAALEWGCALQELTGRAIRCLDIGGGWHPDDFDLVLLPRLPELVARCAEALGGLDVVVIEPGRALVQGLAIVETTVLEVRGVSGAREIVVDAALAEIPRAGVYPHRVLSRAGGSWRQWRRGPDRVLGRLCMEDDVLRVGVAVPDGLAAGDRVLFADAGAYDRSMAYSFGRG